MKILIADDNDSNRILLQFLLRRHGYEVISEPDGAKALERLKTEGADMVVSDILMPVMDGFQLCQEIRADAALKSIPFIFYTATYTGQQDEELALKMGADRFLRKPTDINEFIRVISELIRLAEQGRLESESIPGENEIHLLKLYNERLIKKLEAKIEELEKANQRYREALTSLFEIEFRYRVLLENADEAIFVIQNERIIFSNQKTCELLGYSRKELCEIPFAELIYQDDRKAIHGQYLQMIKGDDFSKTTAFRLSAKNGDILWVQIKSMFTTWEGKPAVLNFLTDMTDQKKLEEQLKQAQKMEAIGTLTGGIAHDFNNILMPIIGYAELLADDTSLTQTARNYLKQILMSAGRARELVQQILTFSRPSDCHERVPLKIQPLVKEAMKMLKAALPSTIQIKFSVSKDCGPVLGNPIEIHQIIMNLCTNAWYAMKESGGVLEVSLAEVDITQEQPGYIADMVCGTYLKLMVKDSGCGMDERVRERIFEPYFSTKPKGEGTGLGLAVVHGIVKSYGGYIHVESSPGAGSLFEIWFPRTQQTELQAKPIRPKPIPKGYGRVLVVDDEEPIVGIFSQFLEQSGYQVMGLTKSVEALMKFLSDPEWFDLIITDMTMPDMTGVELAREIFKVRPDIPIILCTGYSETDVAEKAKASGIQTVIIKPISKNYLIHVVQEVIG